MQPASDSATAIGANRRELDCAAELNHAFGMRISPLQTRLLQPTHFESTFDQYCDRKGDAEEIIAIIFACCRVATVHNRTFCPQRFPEIPYVRTVHWNKGAASGNNGFNTPVGLVIYVARGTAMPELNTSWLLEPLPLWTLFFLGAVPAVIAHARGRPVVAW